MSIPTTASSELADPQRLRALHSTRLLDTPAERVFDQLTDLAVRVLGVQVSLISLVTEDRQFFKSQCGLPSPVAEDRQTPLSYSFCQHVVVDRQPLVLRDVRDEPRVADNLAVRDLGAAAYAGFPLRDADGQVLGSFCAIDTQPRDWTDADLDLLRTLARATMDVVALRNEAIAAGQANRDLQAALVPAPPALEGIGASVIYRPGEQRLLLGGDFLVCSERADGTVGLLLGDVAGHGAAAAGFAIALRSAWEVLQLLAPGSLAAQVAQLNTLARAQQPGTASFATAIACVVDPATRRAGIVLAGHPAPIALAAAGAREVPLPVGPPLGVIDGGRWEVGELQLEPGERLLAYTDGLVEGYRDERQTGRWGAEALIELAGGLHATARDGDALLSELVAAAVAANAAALPDDVAAILLEL